MNPTPTEPVPSNTVKSMEPLARIGQAFLQLQFAIKLMTYLEMKREQDRDAFRQEFDRDLTVVLPGRNLVYPGSAFRRYKDLIIGAQNSFMITFEFSAITLDSSMELVGWSRDPNDRSPRGQLRSLVYMVRCAVAHNAMTPSWKVKPKYQYALEILELELQVDLKALNGRPFEDKHIGGMEGWFAIRDQTVAFLSRGTPSNEIAPAVS